MRRRDVLTATVGGVLGLAGCVSSGGSADYDIGMSASAFRPATYDVEVGTVVRWRNTNSRAHTVTAYEAGIPDAAPYFATGGYDSESAARTAYTEKLGGSLYSDEVFEYRFEHPGEYEYFCIPHELGGMVGTISVIE